MDRRMKRTFEVDNNSIYRLLKKLVDEVAGIKEVITEVANRRPPSKLDPVPKWDNVPYIAPGAMDGALVPVKKKRGRPAGSKKNEK